jgi:hypothetical protein
MMIRFPTNAERVMGKWRFFIGSVKVFDSKVSPNNRRECLQRTSEMAGLTVGDDSEWEDIKSNLVNSEASLKSRLIAIQRLAKECAVGMKTAEAIVDRWAKEHRDEIRKTREKFTIGDMLKEGSKYRDR